METSVEQLIKERSFASLSAEERASVKELCTSEEEFLAMKQFFRELDTVSASHRTIISPEVKNSLDGIFSAKHPGLRSSWTAPEPVAAAPAAPVIPLYKRTWVRVAAAVILILGTAPFRNMLKNDIPAQNKPVTAQLQKPAVAPANSSDKNKNITTGPGFVQSRAVAPEMSIADKAEPVYDREQQVVYDEVQPASIAASDYTYDWKAKDDQSQTSTKFANAEKQDGLTATYSLSQGYTSFQPNALYFSSARNDNEQSMAAYGREADLHPGDAILGNNGANALSLAQQPDDLLDLLTPAF